MPEDENQATLDLSPSKETYRSVQSDVTPITAIKELVDNTIDNWNRIEGRDEQLKVELDIDQDSNKLVIRDNSGGLERENIHMIFALGQSTKESISEPIGAYGMGAKKAIVKLGKSAVIKSRFKDSDTGYGFEVGEEWLESDSWEVDRQSYPDMNSGVTEIEIRNLKDDLESLIPTIQEELRETYEHHLRDFSENPELERKHTLGTDLSIEINGEEIEPPGPPEWSFTPFDSLHPRRFQNIELTEEDEENPIYMHVTVGLLAKGTSGEGGTDIFCQNRKVVNSNTGEKGGYGSGNDRIGTWSSQVNRLKVIIEFETEGDADRLPWDTQKNDIDVYHGVLQKAYKKWVSRIAKPYRQATYRDVPSSFTAPYTSDNERAVNNGEISSYDYKDRYRITDKPDTSFPEIEQLEEVVNKHLQLGVKCSEVLESWKRPAYNALMRKTDKDLIDDWQEISSSKSKEEIYVVEDVPWQVKEEQFREKARNLANTAKEHAKEGIKLDETDEWWYDLYLAKLSSHSSEPLNELTYISEVDSEEEEETNKDDVKEEDSGETETSSEEEQSEETEESSGEESSENSETDSEEEGKDEDQDEKDSQDDESKEDSSTDEEEEDSSESSDDSQEESESVDEQNSEGGQEDENSEEVDSENDDQEDTEGSDDEEEDAVFDPSEMMELNDDNTRIVGVEINEEHWPVLCSELGLPEDADKDRVGDKLTSRITMALTSEKSETSVF
ncbi:MAG: ATP-binding protein [Candidatus Nanohaloarchaea archaeon]